MNIQNKLFSAEHRFSIAYNDKKISINMERTITRTSGFTFDIYTKIYSRLYGLVILKLKLINIWF
jgi:hypothetical protein